MNETNNHPHTQEVQVTFTLEVSTQLTQTDLRRILRQLPDSYHGDQIDFLEMEIQEEAQIYGTE